tara:strand:- start:260 stop:421 length:162 start_codon:yes stop_codon:yes gene_type:complete
MRWKNLLSFINSRSKYFEIPILVLSSGFESIARKVIISDKDNISATEFKIKAN